MAADARIAAVLFLVYAAPFVSAQGHVSNQCSYMTAIPREPRPDDLEDIPWTGGWNERPLIPAPARDDLCMGEYIGGTQLILMDEEIEGDIAIAKLNYDGPEEPYIVLPMAFGSFNLLLPEIRQVDGEWFLFITQRQDFETPGMQRYTFNIRVDNEPITAIITVMIVNIDDNDPIIHVLQACQVPELGEARLTECVYEVTDIDGEISTRQMTFEVTSDRGDDLLFYIEGTPNPSDWSRMTMTVGINAALNFEENPLHIFQVTALDSFPNIHTVTLMVQVENVEHRPPRWVEIFAVQRFDEKTSQRFTVRAIDGDTGINKPIYYRLITAENDTFFRLDTIPGGRNGTILYVDPIDRDTLEIEVFQLIIVAYKYDNESFATEASVTIIVDDINDQKPEPLYPEYTVNILEETPLTLEFDKDFGFHDRDLGVHARYEVKLESESPPGAAEAFYIAPTVGYQRQTFVMGTQNHSMLDFEDIPFQNIILNVVATDLDNNTHVGVAKVFINLINWNDELPIFSQTNKTVSFKETEGAGFSIGNLTATDRDIDDEVHHFIIGNAAEFLIIDKLTGNITVAFDDVFDFHRQSQILVQIQAVDTLVTGDNPEQATFNTATSQLVIQLEDVNNTPPSIRLPRGSPQVEENVPENHIITYEITASDLDTTADLKFEIDWKSSYATKQGRETDSIEYVDCVVIETVYPDPDNHGIANGTIIVKEIRYNVTIDFEMFEVLYLTIRVIDSNTVDGVEYDESTFAITILDMNDNRPLWTNNTLTPEIHPFRVRETSNSGVIIGSVLATDIDGPQYNQIQYSIAPTVGKNTPEYLVQIDPVTGQISVNTSGAIDADTPPRYHLYYTVVASDKCQLEECPPDDTYWETEGNITIEIIDTNNKYPEPDTTMFKSEVPILENSTDGFQIIQLFAVDEDRDEMYHTVGFQINYAVNERLRDFFEVDRETGWLVVHYTTNDFLDRDGDEPEHHIQFQLIDNFLSEGDGVRNQAVTEILVILLDVNDNAPELPLPEELPWSISESLPAGERIPEYIYAPDRDEPDTDNSRVGYAILDLTLTNRDLDHELPELFTMIQIENVTGELETVRPLRGYWGIYDITIEAYDHGHPQMNSTETYQLVINPYNFHNPVFVFPIHGTTVRLSTEWALTGQPLRTVSGETLDSIFATDEDGLEAGEVNFSVTGNAEADQYFAITNIGNNAGTLLLSQGFSERIREFQVTITATDGGTIPGSLSEVSTLHVVFVPTVGDPEFDPNTYSVGFVEREVGLTETFTLPEATDPKNYLCDGDCHSIYYTITGGNDAGHFGLDPVQNIIYLVTELDREESISHTLTIAASNNPTPGTVSPDAILTVQVTVREMNPRPIFEQRLYTAGISIADTVNGRALQTVHATHSEGALITYTIDMDTMVVDPSLNTVQDRAFILNPVTGVLTLNIQPTAAMEGMFEFDVVATDTEEATDRTEVKVFLVSAQNRVYFIFLNTVDQIENNRNFIAQVFSAGFEMTCNIDQVVPHADHNGVASESITEMRAHFILDEIPVHASVIEDLRRDTEILISVRNALLEQQIALQDFLTDPSPGLPTANQITIYVLAILAAILAFLVIVLLLTFIIKTRELKRRMKSLSTNKFGSIDSGVNRVGLAAPGTNKYAAEGANPIYTTDGVNPLWNETYKAPDFDAISETSGDSDLIGIEDLPQFRADYFPPEDVTSFDQIIGDTSSSSNRPPISDHSNSFGFNATPFSQEFANDTNFKFRKL